jgi:hypothetical protein
MHPRITFQAIPVLIDGYDTEGRLVLFDGQLAAVLARLDGDAHDAAWRGNWHLEAGFGHCSQPGTYTFKTLDEAGAWIEQRVFSA